MKTIPLTKGKVALVDDDMFEYLNQWEWRAEKTHYGGYMATRACRMSRQIMSCPQGLQVDHINHNTLDNRRCNLRICTRTENKRNGKIRKDNTSGYKGVREHKHNKKWEASIRFNNRRIYLGRFDSKIEAAKAYDKAARKYFGEFMHLNFP